MMEHMIDDVIDEMEAIAEQFWGCQENVYQKLAEYMNRWQQILQKMLNEMCEWAELGEDIPLEIIVSQLKNFEQALDRKDDMMLADVLEFELKETLNYYKGLLAAYDGKER